MWNIPYRRQQYQENLRATAMKLAKVKYSGSFPLKEYETVYMPQALIMMTVITDEVKQALIDFGINQSAITPYLEEKGLLPSGQ